MGATDPPPVVGITADRRWQEQADLFRRRGIDVLHGPTMRTLDLSADVTLRGITEDVVAQPPNWLVATTGMGMRAWLAAAETWGLRDQLLEALGQANIVGRGAKVTSALRQAGLDIVWRAPKESMAEVLDYLAGVEGIAQASVALQLFDPDEHPATTAIRAIARTVVEVPVYRWLLPDDRGPAQRLVKAAVAGELGAVTFTSQPAVRFLLRIAADMGARDALVGVLNDGPVLAACIGPVCAEAAVEEGLRSVVWPEPFRLPPMVRMVAEHLGVGVGADVEGQAE
jgi:uroporphyrinogen-III synthase